MIKKRIIISIKFNSWGASKKRLTKEWIDSRISIFMDYTLKSLKGQTNQDFLTFVTYDKSTETLINQALGRYEALPDNIRFVPSTYNYIFESIKGYDYLYLARVDSDDMYHKSFIQQLHDHIPNDSTEALINQKGYIYDSVNNQLGNYFFRSTPFFTLIYKVSGYLEGKRYSWYPNGHTGVINLKHEIMRENNFVIVVHSTNIHTGFDDGRRQSLITDPGEIQAILQEFM